MSEFVVATDRLELPRHTWFKTVCKYPYEPGSLIVFRIGRRLSVGRWYPNVNGCNWIIQPGLLICLLGCAITILGAVTQIIPPCLN